jgi:hypothetical protein
MWIQVLAEAGNFSLHHCIQTGSGAHPASYPIGTRALSMGVKQSGYEADRSPPSSAEVKEYVELYSPSMQSWCGAQLKKAQWLCFTFYHDEKLFERVRAVFLVHIFHLISRM